MTNKQYEELTQHIWNVLKAVAFGTVVLVSSTLIIFAAITAISVVNTLLGGMYAFALSMCILAGVISGGVFLSIYYGW